MHRSPLQLSTALKSATEQLQTEEEVKAHLLSRGFDPEQYKYDFDVETGTINIRLFSMDKRFVGYNEYRPHMLRKGGHDRKNPGKKRYYWDIPNKNDAQTVFWGVENLGIKPYLFVTEGVFDAAPINMIGEPAIAVLGYNICGSKIQQLKFLGKYLIAILDNDKAGKAGYLKGRNSGKIIHGDLSAVVEMLGGEFHVVPAPYKDFGEMYQDDSVGAKTFIKLILSEESKYKNAIK